MSHIVSVTALGEVFCDGLRLTAVAVEYDKEIDGATLDPSAFSVPGRTVTGAYANIEAATVPSSGGRMGAEGTVTPETGARGRGRFVVVELSPDDEGAALFVHRGRTNDVYPAQVAVAQVGEIKTSGGETYAPENRPISNNRALTPVADDFRQFEYTHPSTGLTLKYNLFIPKDYDPARYYPLVTFIHDLGVTSTDPKTTLIQGFGAVVWASPAEQAKHECFVLAPQYAVQLVNDESETSEYVDITVDLIRSLAARYSIDTDRLYGTGQSGGCMTFIAINIKYPDLLAASFLVAGQWDPAVVAPLAKANLWILVSEGDLKAFPGMNAITSVLEREGAGVSRAIWSGWATQEEFASGVRTLLAEGNHIMYTVLRQGTVVPLGIPDDGGSNHVWSWRIAYQIEGIRDWLFRQVKPK